MKLKETEVGAEKDDSRVTIGRTLRRLSRELAIPVIVAVCFAIYVHFVGHEPEWVKSAGKFFATMFFASWFVGQIVRVNKQLRVESDLQILRGDIGAIHVMLTNLNNVKTEVPPKQVEARQVRTLIDEAEAAMSVGSIRAALMVMGAAMEDALRNFAVSRGISHRPTAPISEVIEKLRPDIGAELASRLRSLWNVRSQIVHRAADTEIQQDAQEIFKAFRAVIDDLAAATVYETGIQCPRCKRYTMGSGGYENVCGNCNFTSDEY